MAMTTCDLHITKTRVSWNAELIPFKF